MVDDVRDRIVGEVSVSLSLFPLLAPCLSLVVNLSLVRSISSITLALFSFSVFSLSTLSFCLTLCRSRSLACERTLFLALALSLPLYLSLAPSLSLSPLSLSLTRAAHNASTYIKTL